MTGALKSFNTDFPAYIGEGNDMDTMSKLNELNEACQKMLEMYKELLILNTDAFQQSVNQMKKADDTLSSAIAGGR